MVGFTQRGFPMANAAPQSYANHARLDPLFHFVLAPLGIVAIIVSVILLAHTLLPGYGLCSRLHCS